MPMFLLSCPVIGYIGGVYKTLIKALEKHYFHRHKAHERLKNVSYALLLVLKSLPLMR